MEYQILKRMIFRGGDLIKQKFKARDGMILYGFCYLTSAGRVEKQLAESEAAVEGGWLGLLLSSLLILSALSSLDLRTCPQARIFLDVPRAVRRKNHWLLH